MNMTIKEKRTNFSNPLIKDVKPKKKFKINRFIVLGLILVVVSVLGYFGYKALEFSNNIGIKINAGDIINTVTETPELKRDSTKKYTTILIVGIDSRGSKSKLQNTDSMIIASYNHETKDLTMFSVPRDLYIEVPAEGWYTKVNAMYAHGEILKKGDGMNYLARVLTSVTGIEIQYKAMVDLQGFVKIIDAVGGITVNVENTFTDYMYPTESRSKPVYETVTFTKGPQKMDGKTALKYARSRHAQSFEGSDFYRARRQQKVIMALKDKIISSDTLLKPQRVIEIMDAIKDNVKLYGIGTDEITAGIAMVKDYRANPGKSYSFVLDPTFANSKVIGRVTAGNLYAIGSLAGLNNYSAIKAAVKLCISKPALYSPNPKIKIYNTGMGSTAAKAKATEIQKKYPYLSIIYMGNLYSNKEGIVVYPRTSTYKGGAAIIADWLSTTNVTKPDYITSGLNGEDITILLGKASTSTE